MRIRTVLDARSPISSQYLVQTLLLAHSWSAARVAAPLDILVVGELQAAVRARLTELGAGVASIPPHPLRTVARSANKLVGLHEASETPILLVDNDVCFLDDVSDLEGRSVRASVANVTRITGAQWDHIETTTSLRPLELEWASPLAEAEGRSNGREPQTDPKLYLNSGLVWVREPIALGEVWARHLAEIARAFDGHPLSTPKVRGCDQIGLATAVAEIDGFDLLPLAYNYRHVCFQLGGSEQAKVLHLQKLAKRGPPPFSKSVTRYWDRRIVRKIREAGASRRPADPDQEQLVDEALSVRDRVLRIAADAGLDAFDFDPDGA
jgi:hypothetical protein